MPKDKLQIILITYNRKKKLQSTVDQLLKSPIKDFDIVVLDNASTDGTSELLDEYAKKHKNIKHIRHQVNIGGNANICRAFEIGAASGKDYVWVLCDDDKYDFSNWAAVENAIESNADIVCVADYIYPTAADKSDAAYQIFQLTFVPAGIYKTSLITDTVLINMYDSIYTMFQQTCLAAHVINNGGKITVLDTPIVFNGLHFEDQESDVSYVRGSNVADVLERRKNTVWVLGFCNIISLLHDKALQQHCMDVSIPYKDIYGNWNNFFNRIASEYLQPDKFNYFYEICNKLPNNKRKLLLNKFQENIINTLTDEQYINHRKRINWDKIIKRIFSIDKTPDKKHHVLYILGMRIFIKTGK